MKKLLRCLTVLVLGAGLLPSCSAFSSEMNMSAVQIADAVLEEFEFPAFVPDITDTDAQVLYYLDLEDVESYSIHVAMMNASNDTLVIVKAKTGKVENVYNSLNMVWEDNKNLWNNYPQSAINVEKAQLFVVEDYCFFIMTEEVDAVVMFIKDMF